MIVKAIGLVFDSAKYRGLALAGAVLALFGWFVLEQRNAGARNAIGKVNTQAEVLSKKATAARARVPSSGNVQWLQRNSCRDC